MTEGGEGVQNSLNLCDVIYERPLSATEHYLIDPTTRAATRFYLHALQSKSEKFGNFRSHSKKMEGGKVCFVCPMRVVGNRFNVCFDPFL